MGPEVHRARKCEPHAPSRPFDQGVGCPFPLISAPLTISFHAPTEYAPYQGPPYPQNIAERFWTFSRGVRGARVTPEGAVLGFAGRATGRGQGGPGAPHGDQGASPLIRLTLTPPSSGKGPPHSARGGRKEGLSSAKLTRALRRGRVGVSVGGPGIDPDARGAHETGAGSCLAPEGTSTPASTDHRAPAGPMDGSGGGVPPLFWGPCLPAPSLAWGGWGQSPRRRA